MGSFNGYMDMKRWVAGPKSVDLSTFKVRIAHVE